MILKYYYCLGVYNDAISSGCADPQTANRNNRIKLMGIFQTQCKFLIVSSGLIVFILSISAKTTAAKNIGMYILIITDNSVFSSNGYV